MKALVELYDIRLLSHSFIKYFHGSVVLEKMPSEKQLQSHNESIITYGPANDHTMPFYQDNYSFYSTVLRSCTTVAVL